ncbi:uncharacterized protein MELLADRAFT_66541 [Melampsora larici-populina 98AG31]|uniref:Uncharacterized protein n=1 Tax=Melampsora larici-populina (strain 98AG31 / pathotype 3-4-7) TaxID=747676 RepID=F4RZN4_MELLP|nr:uncharacterized protein MELLADRAFT_66541 [Melampsora larici-populina 98AG31]EGG02157.1 hypothetical protein MELLADRAFT_66541 [Melampsora larici-populina 98AG31]
MYPINPAKIDQPRISLQLTQAIEDAVDRGEDLSTVAHMLEFLDWQRMRMYATLTTRLQKDGANYGEWVDGLNERVWFFARINDYLINPCPVIHSLFDWILEEILLAMMRATVHPSVLQVLAIASDPHEALM